MKPRRPLRTRLIAAIHVRAKELGLDEDSRRAIQRRCGGAASCRDLDVAGLHRVLDELRRLPGAVAGSVGPPRDNLDGMRRKCLAIAADIGAGANYVNAIARRQRGAPIEDLDAEGLKGVIAALYKYRQRVRRRAPA